MYRYKTGLCARTFFFGLSATEACAGIRNRRASPLPETGRADRVRDRKRTDRPTDRRRRNSGPGHRSVVAARYLIPRNKCCTQRLTRHAAAARPPARCHVASSRSSSLNFNNHALLPCDPLAHRPLLSPPRWSTVAHVRRVTLQLKTFRLSPYRCCRTAFCPTSIVIVTLIRSVRYVLCYYRNYYRQDPAIGM